MDGDTSLPPIITPGNLPQIVAVLLDAIKDEAHIAEKVCYALSQLAAGYRAAPDGTSPLSPYFKDIVQALLETVSGPAGACWNGTFRLFSDEDIMGMQGLESRQVA